MVVLGLLAGMSFVFFFSAASAIVGEFGKVWRMSADCSEYYKADEIGLIAVMS